MCYIYNYKRQKLFATQNKKNFVNPYVHGIIFYTNSYGNLLLYGVDKQEKSDDSYKCKFFCFLIRINYVKGVHI